MNSDKIRTSFFSEQLSDKKIRFLQEKKEEYEEIKALQTEYQELISQETSFEGKSVLKVEIRELEKQKEELINQVKEKLIEFTEKEEGERGVLVEIRPGTGGKEAGLFTNDLYNMYYGFAKRRGWVVKITESRFDYQGRFVAITFLVRGKGVFKWLKSEAGIHRVQRVPDTENKGRIHTSTASVVILPEPQEIDLKITGKDLKIETYRASGPGGQHVNTTDSAVRITHIPTGLTATSQQGRNQNENKANALSVLKIRLYEDHQQRKKKSENDLRLAMIGSSERAEKIRTYNWPQNRVTDHRLNCDWKKLTSIMEGDCEEIFHKLIDYEVEKNLTQLISWLNKPRR